MAEHSRNRDSDVLERVRVFDTPPRDLDPFSASDEVLLRHGFPRRPDPDVEPKLARLWTRAMGRSPRYTKAELAIDEVMSRRDPLRRGEGADFGPSGWGGAVVDVGTLGFGEPANTVYARWQVPAIWSPSGATDDLTVGFWVGIDGAGNSQVLQAGTAATVSTDGHARYWAWTEWYTDKYKDPSVAVTNFIVDPNDVVTFLVCAPRPDHGFVSLFNETTRQATSVGIDARPGITSAGAYTECIVEGASDELPVFCPVTFNSYSAGTHNHAFDLVPGGYATNIGGSSTALTAASIASPTSAVVQWEGAS